MNYRNYIDTFALAVILFAGTNAASQEPQTEQRFEPNYVAISDVPLSSPNGNPLGSLKKGTPVAAREVMGYVLDVKAKDGKYGFAYSSYFSRIGSSINITQAAKQVAESNNQFAFDLYQQTKKQDGNFFFSPASITTALAMTYAGADGHTKKEIASVLHLNRDRDTHEGFSTLLNLLNSTGYRTGYSLSTANRLWAANGYDFEDSFLGLTHDKYRVKLETLNFEKPERARQTINEWVAKQTRKKIVDLIPSGTLKTNTRLVLTNAIYFEGGWSSEFSETATKKAPFRVTAKEEIDVLTMEQQDKFLYTEDDDAQVISMPYRGNELSMVVVLPKKVAGLKELEGKLTNERFAGWMEKLRRDKPVDTYLPKFKMRSQFKLSNVLKAMGMKSAFSANADFSAMSKSEKLMISQVVHQAFVDVDEKGTEAAAATAVMIAPTSVRIEPKAPPEPIVFRANHPFLFVIRDNRTSAVLFIGRMMRPEDDK